MTNIEDPATQTTPVLVRRYRVLHVLESHTELTNAQHAELGEIVEVLRLRGVLD